MNMNTLYPSTILRSCKHELALVRTPARATQSLHAQRGVVLVIALILLVVISLLAVTSMRNASSTENVMGNVRTTQLAYQAAELALSHCELSVAEVVSGAGTYNTTFSQSNIITATTPQYWSSTAIWNTSTSASTPTAAIFVLPISTVNQLDITATTYKRSPECMVETLPVMLTSTAAVSRSVSFLVTARGFGPEVPAVDTARSKPAGTVVWLQSTIEF